MAPKSARLLLILASVFALSAWSLHRWGVTTYLLGIWGPLNHPSPNSNRTQDILLTSPAPKGQVLILHGLNFDAEGMRPLAEVFQELGFNVLAPRLAAHRGNFDEMYSQLQTTWQEQIEAWGKIGPRPLVCVGYSMGGLVVIAAHMQDHVHCDYLFAFSPALSLRTPEWVIQFGRRLLPEKIKFPSAIPSAYRHFDQISLNPSFSLFDTLITLRGLFAQGKKFLSPGLVILDDRDQVVNSAGVRALIRAYFPNVEVIPLQAEPLDEKHAFHMLIDEKHTGTTQWKFIKEKIRSTLPIQK
jgi:esterase/lipase